MNQLKEKTVLVVDDLVAVRSALGQMLASLGIVKVEFAGNGEECLRRMSTRHYDIILCDYYLGEGRDGMQVLEAAKQQHLTDLTTVFVMITAEASTSMVVGAVEHRPDDYLVKPITRQMLQERLPRLINRKEILVDVERFIRAGNLAQAAQLAGEQARAQPQYALDLMQVQVDLLMRLGQFTAAREVVEAAAAIREAFWVKLARGQISYYLGDYDNAKDAFADLITDNLLYIEAYDWLARVHQAQGNFPEAKELLIAANHISSRSIRRSQALGEISLRTADPEMAEQAYRNAVRIGRFSIYCDPNDAARLARLLAERGNYREATRIIKDARKQYQGDIRAILALSIAEGAYCHKLQLSAVATHTLETAISVYQDARNTLPPDLAIELARLCQAYNMPQAAGIVTDIVFAHIEDAVLMQRARELFRSLGMAQTGEKFIHGLWTKVAEANSTGVRLIQEGKLDDAQQFLEKAANAMPFNPTINLNAARVILLIVEERGYNEKLLTQAKKYLDEIPNTFANNDKFQQLQGMWTRLSQLPEEVSSS